VRLSVITHDRFLLSTFIIVAAFTALRVVHIFTNGFDLFFDEAQYWIWAQIPDWGYYSKPPMVAWLITATTSFCGDTEGCIRLASPVLHMATSLSVFFIARKLFNERTALLSALTYITLPAVGLSSMLISTDPALLFFWSIALLGLVYALDSNQWKWWLLAGIAGGFGMLSKYNMLLFVLSTLGFLATSPTYRHHLKNYKLWTAMILALMMFIPNIIWNADHGFVSFLHTKDNAQGNGFEFSPKHFLEFFGAQFGVFGPLLFGTLLYLTYTKRSHPLLAWSIWPMLGLILVISFVTRAHANWAAPIYVPATIMVVHYLVEHGKIVLVKASLMLHVFLWLVVLVLPYSNLSFTSDKTSLSHWQIQDPFIRLRGWSELASAVKTQLTQHPDVAIITNSRKIFTELAYYLRHHDAPLVKWNPDGSIRDHFDLTTSINNSDHSGPFIFVGRDLLDEHLNLYFKQVTLVSSPIIIQQRPKDRQYYVYYLEGLSL
tara:strand:- start:191 stop:1657 length:1467 start_codon:yes stop_codon:yes gene_type:complete